MSRSFSDSAPIWHGRITGGDNVFCSLYLSMNALRGVVCSWAEESRQLRHTWPEEECVWRTGERGWVQKTPFLTSVLLPRAGPGTYRHRRAPGHGKADEATSPEFPKWLSNICLTLSHSCRVFFLFSVILCKQTNFYFQLKTQNKTTPNLSGLHSCKHSSATSQTIQVFLSSKGRCGLKERCLRGIYSLWPINQMG